MALAVDDFIEGDKEWLALLRRWESHSHEELRDATRDISVEWQREAKLRVPVESGLARNTIQREHGIDDDGDFFAAVGSNRKYAPYIEFGTDRIAGGRVKALGDDPEIEDGDAVTEWPAKGEDGASREQMPWLRPAFMAIRDWVEDKLIRALRPPK